METMHSVNPRDLAHRFSSKADFMRYFRDSRKYSPHLTICVQSSDICLQTPWSPKTSCVKFLLRKSNCSR